jgi:hypothetical protein
MSEDLVANVVRLADVLRRENSALAALDLARAASMLAEKRMAADALSVAQSMSGSLGGASDRPKLLDAASELKELATENRVLLERAMAVQSRVIGVMVRAAPPAPTPRYEPTGVLRRTGRPIAFTLSARA